MTDVHSLSENIADAVARVAPAVVSVHGRRRAHASGITWEPQRILTANHAVRGERVKVVDATGQEHEASVVGRHHATDLALLSIEGSLPVASWTDDGEVRVGNLVFPLGRGRIGTRASLALIAGLGGPWRTALGGQVDRYFDIDGTLGRGMSGSALIDTAGRVLGMNTRELVPGGTTIPTATIRRVVGLMAQRTNPGRGHLGVGVQPVELPQDLVDPAGQRAALLVVSIQPESPAAQAGIMLGDALLSLDGVSLARVRDLLASLSDGGPGTTVALRVVRAGAIHELTVTLATRT
jgi:S1-C subfamily serine protease